MHGHGHGHGRGPWGRKGFGGPPWGPMGPMGGHGGPRARRGDVQAAILALLSEKPMHGYQVIQELGERSNGAWTPSPGSVYPTLQMMEDEGLVASEQVDGKRVFSLTAEGSKKAEALPSKTPWEEMATDGPISDLRNEMGSLAGAAMQVARTGTPEQVAAAAEAIAKARKKLYTMLAD